MTPKNKGKIPQFDSAQNDVIPEEDDDEERLFRANPVPLYPEVSPHGLNDHLERM